MRGRNNSRVGKLFLFTRVQEPRLADPFPEAPSSREFRHKRPQHDSPAGAVFFWDARGGELGHLMKKRPPRGRLLPDLDSGDSTGLIFQSPANRAV